MIPSTIRRVSGLGAGLALCIACEAKIHNLGDEATAGTGGQDTDSTPGTGGKTSRVTDNNIGGTSPGTITINLGGSAGTTTTPTNFAYPLAPTLPVDANCTCTSSDQICNASGQCVDRCDSAGHCAKWLTNHAVKGMLIEGSSLYFATSPARDVVGNAGTDGSLYRVTIPNGTPTLIATNLGDPGKIVGRYNGATYISSIKTGIGGVYRVADGGEVKLVANDTGFVSLRGKWLAFTTSDGQMLKLIALDGDWTPHVVAALPTPTEPNDIRYINSPTVTDNYVFYVGIDTSQWCSVPLSQLEQGVTCSGTMGPPFGEIIAEGDTLYANYSTFSTATSVAAYTVEGTPLRGLYGPGSSGSATAGERITISQLFLDRGFAYILIHYGVSDYEQLIRVPMLVGRLPQEVLAKEIANPSFDSSNATTYDGDFVVSEAGLFWCQRMRDPNHGQYIFHSPLPAQPCDAELPCVDVTQTCTNGYCVAP